MRPGFVLTNRLRTLRYFVSRSAVSGRSIPARPGPVSPELPHWLALALGLPVKSEAELEASKKALGSALGMEYVGHGDFPLGQGHPPEGKAAARALEEIWASLSPAARGLLAAGAYLSAPYSIDDVADLLRCDVDEAFARHAELVRVRESVMAEHPAAPPLFEVEAAGWSYLVGRHYVELVPHLVKKTISPVTIGETSREGFGTEGAPTSRHQNIFYYYRGPSKADESADAQHRQIENNTTKALVNVLEYGSADLTASFLARFVPDAPRQVRPTRRYYLQRGPERTDDPCWLLGVSVLGDIDPRGEIKARGGGSLLDAAIHLPGDALVAIEVKVVEYLDYEQLRRHATEWGVAQLPAERLIENWLAPTGRVANFAGDLEPVVFRRRPSNYLSVQKDRQVALVRAGDGRGSRPPAPIQPRWSRPGGPTRNVALGSRPSLGEARLPRPLLVVTPRGPRAQGRAASGRLVRSHSAHPHS